LSLVVPVYAKTKVTFHLFFDLGSYFRIFLESENAYYLQTAG